MPIPKPEGGESQEDFIQRCMGNPTMNSEYPDNSQRFAVCQSSYESTEKQDGFKPTQEMAEEAQRGLEWRDEFNRGGTEIGVARARDISNKRNLSFDTVQRMNSYFARHEVDKEGEGFSPGEDGYPSAGRIAWALWGGDPGKTWAANIVEREIVKELQKYRDSFKS